MQVRDGMSTEVLTVGPDHSLRAASRAMSSRRVGSAVVHDPDGEGVGIITERDLLTAIGHGLDPDSEHVRDHLTTDLIYAAPSWTLEQAAEAMMRAGFRHLVVLDGGEVAGILSVRDIVRVWARERAGDELVG
ncbi:MAG: CBS domain-containing protein [Actinomycetes bacterium]